MNESKEDALVGRTIAGKFLIESFIGAGAMGAVYKARQMALEKVIALKVLHPDRAEDSIYGALFHREARAASRLDHPNSVRVVDFGQEPDGLLYIAMEYFAGRDLQRVLTEDWPLSPYRVADILSQALAGIAVAHEMGIVHRDLKPENILLQQGHDDEGEAHDVVKVCDFGIAKFTNAGEGDPGRTGRTARHATEGLIFGTPHYMAPEQARGEGLDARTDVYSMGVILYQMLTSRLPFEGKTLLDVAIKHVHDEPLPPRQHTRWVDERLETICLKALRKNKKDRYQSAREMRADLRAVMSALPSTPELPHPPSSRDAPTQPPQDPDRLPTSQTPGPTSSPLRRLRRRAVLPLVVLSTTVAAGVGALRARPHRSNDVVTTPRPSSEGVDINLLQARASNAAPNLEIASNLRMLPSLEASEPVGTAPSKQGARANAYTKGKAVAPAFAANPTAAEAVESSSQSEKDHAISPSLPPARRKALVLSRGPGQFLRRRRQRR
jgi:serine/threonine protein kinase